MSHHISQAASGKGQRAYELMWVACTTMARTRTREHKHTHTNRNTHTRCVSIQGTLHRLIFISFSLIITLSLHWLENKLHTDENGVSHNVSVTHTKVRFTVLHLSAAFVFRVGKLFIYSWICTWNTLCDTLQSCSFTPPAVWKGQPLTGCTANEDTVGNDDTYWWISDIISNGGLAENIWDEQPLILSAFIIGWQQIHRRKLTLAHNHLSQALCVLATECGTHGRWIRCKGAEHTLYVCFELPLHSFHIYSHHVSFWLEIYPPRPTDPTPSFICPVRQCSSVIG